MRSMMDKEQALLIYKKMVLLRKCEQKANELFMLGFIPGTVHLYIGEEACAVGVISNLGLQDKVFLSHRPHGGALAKGLEPEKLFSELLGRAGGCTRGKGGSMHLVDVEKGIMPTMPIIGASIVLANGVAFAEKQKNSGNIAAAFFGDGCSNIGAFHEGLNIAAVMKLPVVFICENNLYAVSTRISSTCLLSNISERAKSYGMPGIAVDGNDVEAVYQAAKQAVEMARWGDGPTLLECKTYRHLGHSRTDPATYRPKSEVDLWKARDPIEAYRKRLTDGYHCTETEITEVEHTVESEVAAAAEQAKSSPLPESFWATENVYAE